MVKYYCINFYPFIITKSIGRGRLYGSSYRKRQATDGYGKR